MSEPDLGTAIGKLMEDPEALSGIMQMAKALMGGESGSPPTESGSADAGESTAPLPMELSNAAKQPHPPKKTAGYELLNALRPFLSPERCERMDGLLKMMQLMEIAGVLLKTGGSDSGR